MKHLRNRIRQAVELAGGAAAVGRQLGVSCQAVSVWASEGAIPPRRVWKFCELIEFGIQPRELAPELYPFDVRELGIKPKALLTQGKRDMEEDMAA